jgi:hypothetical protein
MGQAKIFLLLAFALSLSGLSVPAFAQQVGQGNMGTNNYTNTQNTRVYTGNSKQNSPAYNGYNSGSGGSHPYESTPDQCRLAGKSYPCE